MRPSWHQVIHQGRTTVTVKSRMGSYALLANEAIWQAIVDTGTELRNDVAGGGPNAAPILDGWLRKSYRILFFRNELRLEVGNDGRIAYYALYVEYGTVNGGWGRNGTRAQPHLRPAAATQTPLLAERIKVRMRQIRMSVV